jgi:hypothetical protein
MLCWWRRSNGSGREGLLRELHEQRLRSDEVSQHTRSCTKLAESLGQQRKKKMDPMSARTLECPGHVINNCAQWHLAVYTELLYYSVTSSRGPW